MNRLGAPFRWNWFAVTSSRLAYVLIAWPTATLPALAFGVLANVITPEYGVYAPESPLSVWVTVWAIGVAPIIETGLMILIYYALRVAFPWSEVLQAVVLAAVAALAHSINDSWLRAVWVFWPFCVYSVALVSWHKRSMHDAFIVSASIHALHNTSVVAIAAVLVRGI